MTPRSISFSRISKSAKPSRAPLPSRFLKEGTHEHHLGNGGNSAFQASRGFRKGGSASNDQLQPTSKARRYSKGCLARDEEGTESSSERLRSRPDNLRKTSVKSASRGRKRPSRPRQRLASVSRSFARYQCRVLVLSCSDCPVLPGAGDRSLASPDVFSCGTSGIREH
jgi:hypothetical protein